MKKNEFIKRYNGIVQYAMSLCEKARREGLLALDTEIDREKVNERDILEYGIRLAIDGFERGWIDEVLTAIVQQENDADKRTLKNIQKAAALSIAKSHNPRMMALLLNSYTPLSLKDDEWVAG